MRQNIDQFIRNLGRLEDDMLRSAQSALDDIKDDWVRGARDDAPLDTGNLRRQINGEVKDDSVIVTGNATNRSGRSGRFNYGYWLHEKAPSSTNLSTPGTKLKFLESTAKEREDEWVRWIQEGIETAARQRGF